MCQQMINHGFVSMKKTTTWKIPFNCSKLSLIDKLIGVNESLARIWFSNSQFSQESIWSWFSRLFPFSFINGAFPNDCWQACKCPSKSQFWNCSFLSFMTIVVLQWTDDSNCWGWLRLLTARPLANYFVEQTLPNSAFISAFGVLRTELL